MRVPADQFFGYSLHHIAEVKRAVFFGHAGMKHNLQQKIAEFFFKIREITAHNGVGNFVRFLQCVRRDRGKILRQIPGAAGFRSAQRSHDFEKATDVA
jgi:hypothetical protein